MDDIKQDRDKNMPAPDSYKPTDAALKRVPAGASDMQEKLPEYRFHTIAPGPGTYRL